MLVTLTSPYPGASRGGLLEAAERATRPREGPRPSNLQVAECLDEVASLLEAQGANAFRVEAYRKASGTLRSLEVDLRERLGREGRPWLESLPGIGRGLSAAIVEILDTGRLRLLDRLRGAVAPEDLFASLPGIGPGLARRMHEELGAETLEDLELAAWNGRLERVSGFGPRRVAALRSILDARLSRSSSRRRRRAVSSSTGATPLEWGPSVEALLSVDAEYRRKAEAGVLPRIAPRRFNPRGTAWLPVLHTERGGWAFHAFFSNTALAHRLGRTHEWVVIYYEQDGEEGQATVVTERQGDLAALRVVRGRELECRRHYLQGTRM